MQSFYVTDEGTQNQELDDVDSSTNTCSLALILRVIVFMSTQFFLKKNNDIKIYKFLGY